MNESVIFSSTYRDMVKNAFDRIQSGAMIHDTMKERIKLLNREEYSQIVILHPFQMKSHEIRQLEEIKNRLNGYCWAIYEQCEK